MAAALRQRKKKKKASPITPSLRIDADKSKLSTKHESCKNATVLVSWILFFVTFGAYLSNGSMTPSGDALSNLYMPFQILRHGKLSWNPTDCPGLFHWYLKDEKKVVNFMSTLDGVVMGISNENDRNNVTGHEAIDKYGAEMRSPKYMLVKSRIAGDNSFVNTFNIGTGISFVPVIWLLSAVWYGFDLYALQQDSWLVAYAGKTCASALVAASVVLVYKSARILCRSNQRQALTVAIMYGLGSCTWSVSSQALCQHAPNEFYLSLAIWAFLRIHQILNNNNDNDSKSTVVLLAATCGIAVSMATMCRPTSVVVAIAIGVYFLLEATKHQSNNQIWCLSVYVMVGAVFGSFQLYYNFVHLGSPFEFGQQQASRSTALQKTGSANLWPTLLWTGASTLLFSPNRGLFVFSPFCLFCMPALLDGVWRSTKDNNHEFHKVLRPLSVSIGILWMVAFKFFDYWGGWCFGYRPLVDTMPKLVLFLCPMMNTMERNRFLRFSFWITAFYSVLVQYVGAHGYFLFTWNSREGVVFRPQSQGQQPQVEWAFDAAGIAELQEKYPDAPFETTRLDIDKPEYRSRLWSWTDSQILYILSHFEDQKRYLPGKANMFF